MSRYRTAPLLRHGADHYYGVRRAIDARPQRDDRYYEVQPGDDLTTVAYRLLGRAEYWWVVADYNQIIDPFEPLVPGTRLRLPSEARAVLDVLR